MLDLVVKIENVNGINVVSSRVVAEQLGKDLQDVKKKIRDVLEIGTEYFPVQIKVRGKDSEDYLLTKDGFVLLCMNYTGYNEFKRAYIKKFNEMEKQVLSQKTPLTYKEALIALIEAEEEKERILLEHKTEVTAITNNLKNVQVDIRTNIKQGIFRLAEMYNKHHRLSGVNAENVRASIFQTVYTGFFKEYNINFEKEVKPLRHVSLKTGNVIKNKNTIIDVLEHMELLSFLMTYVQSINPTEIVIEGRESDIQRTKEIEKGYWGEPKML